MIRFLILLAGFFLLLVSTAWAHELRPAFLEVNEIAPARYAITWKVPARGDARMALYVRLPETCRQEVEPVGGFIETAYVSRWQMECVGALAGQVISIDGLTSTYTDALAKIVNLDGTTQTSRISPDFPDLMVAASPTAFGTARTYFFLGVQHIMLGSIICCSSSRYCFSSASRRLCCLPSARSRWRIRSRSPSQLWASRPRRSRLSRRLSPSASCS